MGHFAPGVFGGHADSFATSIALYLQPEVVRVDEIPEPDSEPVDWNNPDLDFACYSQSGVIGDATHATADLGAKLWNTAVEAIALTFKEIARSNLAA